MKIKKIEKKVTFWTWLHRNRIKVAVLAFLIILPIALVLTAYIGSYTANRKVTFDDTITEESEYIKDFLNPDEIDAFEMTIVWNELKHPVGTVDEEGFENGYYEFLITYAAQENFTVKNVTIVPVLQTDWTNLRAVGTPVSLTNTATVTVLFNHDLPVKPLLFVTVSEPHLYLMVQYTLTTGGQDVSFIEYVQFSLKDINPLNVIN